MNKLNASIAVTSPLRASYKLLQDNVALYSSEGHRLCDANDTKLFSLTKGRTLSVAVETQTLSVTVDA